MNIIRNKILDIIREIDKELTIIGDDINLDSLQNVQLIYRIEKEFNINVPYEYLDPDNIKSLKRLVELIEDIKQKE